jgi:hypothetical protein
MEFCLLKEDKREIRLELSNLNNSIEKKSEFKQLIVEEKD